MTNQKGTHSFILYNSVRSTISNNNNILNGHADIKYKLCFGERIILAFTNQNNLLG